MNSTLQRNLSQSFNEEIGKPDGISSEERGCRSSLSETPMTLVNLLEVPIESKLLGKSAANPPKKPKRQWTIENLEEVLDMIDDIDICHDEVSALSSTPDTVHGLLDHHAWRAPKCPSRKKSFDDSYWLFHHRQEDDDEFNLALPNSETTGSRRRGDDAHSLQTTPEDEEEAISKRLSSSSSLPPKFPRRSVDAVGFDHNALDVVVDPCDCFQIEREGDCEDVAVLVVRHGNSSASRVWRSISPPRLPSRHISDYSEDSNSTDNSVVRQCSMPSVFKRTISLPIDLLAASTPITPLQSMSQKEHNDAEVKETIKGRLLCSPCPPQCPRRRESFA